MSDDKAEAYHDLVAKASALRKKLKKLRQADAPVLVDVDYDACFVKAHQELIAKRNLSPVPRPLLRAKLLESLKNEREGLTRVLADQDSQLMAAEREIADWNARMDAVTRDDATSSSVPSDYRAVRELARMRLNQIVMYLDDYYRQPPKEDQAVPFAGAGDGAEHSSSCDYLTLSELVEDLLVASTQPGDLQYVKLGPKHWPAHVELLVDSKVAERDPQRSNHIRLTNWD